MAEKTCPCCHKEEVDIHRTETRTNFYCENCSWSKEEINEKPYRPPRVEEEDFSFRMAKPKEKPSKRRKNLKGQSKANKSFVRMN